MDRQEFTDLIYAEFETDPDNIRANRIIAAADEYAGQASAEPGITFEAVMEYCNKQCLTIMTNDCYYRLISGVKYKPATLDDFPKTMSAEDIYNFWEQCGEAISQMNKMGFVVCKETTT